MTTREYLRRRAVLATAVALVAALILFAAKFLGTRIPAALVVTCFLAFVASALIINFGLRCVVCRANLAILFAGLFSFSSGRRAKVCPYCKTPFDLTVEQAQQAAAGDARNART
jgi:hypothetical protein